MLRQSLFRVSLDCFGEVFLVAALRNPQLHLRSPKLAQPRLDLGRVCRQNRHQNFLGNCADPGLGTRSRVEGRLLPVELGEELLDQDRQVGLGVECGPVDGVACLLHDPSTLTPHASAAHVEHLNGGFEIIGGKGDEIGVGAVTEYDGLLLERLAQSPDIVTQTGCGLEVEVLGSLLHALFEIFDQLVRAAGEEVAEIFDDLTMLLGADSPDAGRRALVDVAEQTRPADLVVSFEDSGRARSCGKDS